MMLRHPLRQWLAPLLAAIAALSITLAAPAWAHKDHLNKQADAAKPAPVSDRKSGAPPIVPHDAPAMHGDVAMDVTHDGQPTMSTGERAMNWAGRLHPMLVHFPIAFFIGGLFTAIVGRRREAFGKPVQFLVVAGGITAPVAAGLGWLDALGADPDPLLTVHRWLGTAIAAGGFSLALWVLRKPDRNRSNAMIAGLLMITAAIIVQGWYGGALVHGIDHMKW